MTRNKKEPPPPPLTPKKKESAMAVLFPLRFASVCLALASLLAHLASGLVAPDSSAARKACSQFRYAGDCFAASGADAECGFCAASYNCFPRNAALEAEGATPCSVSVCPATPPFLSSQDSIDAFYARNGGKNPVLPDVGWDLACSNGGKRFWNADKNRGNHKCVCPASSGFGGLECRMCASKKGCEGDLVCDTGLIPRTNASTIRVHGMCKSGAMCLLASTQAGGGLMPELSMELLPHAETEAKKDARVKIYVSVPFPKGANPDVDIAPGSEAVISSPLLANIQVKNCVVERSVQCPFGVTFGWSDAEFQYSTASCTSVTCEDTEGASIEPCPANVSWYKEASDVCSAINTAVESTIQLGNAAGTAIQVMCAEADQGKGPAALYADRNMYMCSLSVGALLPHGSLVAEMECGACVEEIMKPPEKTLELSWCKTHQSACNGILFFLGVVVPFLPLLTCLLAFHLRRRRDRALWISDKASIDSGEELRNLSKHLAAYGSSDLAPIGEIDEVSMDAELGAVSLESEGEGSFSSGSGYERPHYRSNSLRSNTLGWDGKAWLGEEKLTEACTRIRTYLTVDSIPSNRKMGKKISVADLSAETLQLGLVDVRLKIKQPKSFVKSLRSRGRTNSRESLRSVEGAPRTHILCSTNGTIGPGITAILGPSGCGKTTLIDIIAGRKSTGVLSGKVVVSGRTRTPAELRALVGYVLQEDVLPGTSTVRECLMFHAMLRLRSDVGRAEQVRRVKRVLKEMNMHKHADSIIGDAFNRGLSGGQKRRVSICIELLASPKLVIMDEPTSGLDSVSTKNVIDALGTVASGNERIVVISIHQPSSVLFLQFDNVILLSPKGETVYFGPRKSVLPFLASSKHICPPGINPSEFCLDIVSLLPSAEVTELSNNFAASNLALSQAEELSASMAKRAKLHESMHRTKSVKWGAPPKEWHLPSMWRQFSAVGFRCFTNLLRHPLLILGNVVLSAFVGIICGLFYSGLDKDFQLSGVLNRAGVISFTLLYFLLNSLVAMSVWIDERLLYLREKMGNCYTPGSYLIAKTLFSVIPMQVCSTMAFVFVSYFWVGMNSDADRFVVYSGILLLCNIAGASMMIMVGTMTGKPAVAYMIGVVVLLFNFLFEGILANQSHLKAAGVGWVSYLSYLHFAFEALVFNEMKGQSYEICKAGVCFPITVEDIVQDNLGMDIGGGFTIQRDAMILFAYFILFNILTYALLKYRVREKR